MAEQRLKISQLHLAGIAPSKFEGRAGSVAEAVAIDFHSSKGTFQASQALVAEATGTVPDERVDNMIACSDGNIYAFSKTSGKVWKRIANGTWSLAYTTVPTSGTAGTLGAIEFEGYLYWATQSYIHRILVTGTSDWATNAVPNWQLLPVTDAEYHPMTVLNNRLLVGDGNKIHQIYLASFTAEALDIISSHRVTTMNTFDVYVIAGSIVDNYINKSTFYRWNGYSSSWNIESVVSEIGTNAIVPVGNSTFVHAGRAGNFYSYDGSFLSSAFLIPGTYTGTNEAIVYPNAVTNYMGKALFGISNKVNAPVTAGIYSYFTSNTMLYPRVLSLEYVIAMADIGASCAITSVVARGTDLFVAYTNATVSGIKKVDMATKQDGAYIASRVAYIDRNEQVSGWKVTVNYTTLPASTSVEIWEKLNYADSWTQLVTTVDTDRKCVIADTRDIANVYEWKVVLRTHNNDSPIIDEINIDVAN